MSEIKVDALTGKTAAGDITVTSEGGAVTMQLQQGLCKMWGVVDQTLTTHVIDDSFNVASVADAGQGRTQFNFVNDMNNGNYCVLGLTRDGGGNNDDAGLHSDTGSPYDSEKFELIALFDTTPNDCNGAMWAAVMGDLA